jgi:hypothetical protein
MTKDNTLILKSPYSKSKITLECLEDVEKFHGKDTLKDVLYELYLSVIDPKKFGTHIEVTNHAIVKSVK